MKGIEIPFGAKDSELCGWEYTIPEGMEAVVEGGKVIVRRKESEDERIRKGLVHFILYKAGTLLDEETEHKFVAYLEKQKEQPMSAEEVLIRAGLKPYRDGNQWCVLAGGNIQEGICGFGDTIDEALYQFLMEVLKIQKEQKPAARENDFVSKPKNSVEILKHYLTWATTEEENCPYSWKELADAIKDGIKALEEQQPAEWSEEDEAAFGDLMWCVEQARKSAKDENDMGNIWFAENWLNRRLKSLRPRPRWKPSEQEKAALRTAICVLTEERNFPKTAGHLQAILDAFEGKESRKGWKPSDEQMQYLLAVINDPNNIGAESCYMTIKSLYNDLKKL